MIFIIIHQILNKDDWITFYHYLIRSQQSAEHTAHLHAQTQSTQRFLPVLLQTLHNCPKRLYVMTPKSIFHAVK